jgi:hypothetical protein
MKDVIWRPEKVTYTIDDVVRLTNNSGQCLTSLYATIKFQCEYIVYAAHPVPIVQFSKIEPLAVTIRPLSFHSVSDVIITLEDDLWPCFLRDLESKEAKDRCIQELVKKVREQYAGTTYSRDRVE